jgi:hypothetical protein
LGFRVTKRYSCLPIIFIGKNILIWTQVILYCLFLNMKRMNGLCHPSCFILRYNAV